MEQNKVMKAAMAAGAAGMAGVLAFPDAAHAADYTPKPVSIPWVDGSGRYVVTGATWDPSCNGLEALSCGDWAMWLEHDNPFPMGYSEVAGTRAFNPVGLTYIGGCDPGTTKWYHGTASRDLYTWYINAGGGHSFHWITDRRSGDSMQFSCPK